LCRAPQHPARRKKYELIPARPKCACHVGLIAWDTIIGNSHFVPPVVFNSILVKPAVSVPGLVLADRPHKHKIGDFCPEEDELVVGDINKVLFC
jgi:hypothetical protein